MCSSLFRFRVWTSFDSLTIRKELNFKSENLFRMCSVVTNMVTSLEFQPIRCATTLFQFGRTRNGYVATRITLLSSTAERSATSGYVVAPERSGQSEAWAGRNVERARNKPGLFPAVDLIDTVDFFIIYKFYFIHFKLFFFTLFSHFPLLCSFVYVIIYCVGAGITTLMSIFPRIELVPFPSKDGKDAVREGRNGRRSVYCRSESASFPL